jgi:hypothetical protein
LSRSYTAKVTATGTGNDGSASGTLSGEAQLYGGLTAVFDCVFDIPGLGKHDLGGPITLYHTHDLLWEAPFSVSGSISYALPGAVNVMAAPALDVASAPIVRPMTQTGTNRKLECVSFWRR